jgi:hypothetical protein
MQKGNIFRMKDEDYLTIGVVTHPPEYDSEYFTCDTIFIGHKGSISSMNIGQTYSIHNSSIEWLGPVCAKRESETVTPADEEFAHTGLVRSADGLMTWEDRTDVLTITKEQLEGE